MGGAMKEALKLALEALEGSVTPDFLVGQKEKKDKAITAIKEALAQPEQEPLFQQGEHMTHEAGKGDKQRPTDYDKFNESFEKIFGVKITKEKADEFNRQLQDALAEDEEFERIAKGQK
jgi:hypothetical protein